MGEIDEEYETDQDEDGRTEEGDVVAVEEVEGVWDQEGKVD